MGALNRATVEEIEELAAGDAWWWRGFCGQIAEEGREAIKSERDARGWSWSALWGWIVADEGRYRDYLLALEAYVQDKALETVGVADDATPETVGVAKLRVETRFRLAGKVDRGRWGEKTDLRVERVLESEEALLARLRALVAANPHLREIVVGSGIAVGLEAVDMEIIEVPVAPLAQPALAAPEATEDDSEDRI